MAGEKADHSDTPDDRLTRAVVLSLGPESRRREAVAILEKLAAEMPENAKVQESLARALLGAGDAEAAPGPSMRRPAAAALDAPAESIRLAVTLDLAANDADAAVRQLARLEAVALDGGPTLDLRARVLKAQGKPSEAVAALEKAFDAAERSPGALDFGRGLIRLLTSLGEPDAAERMARRVARLGPTGPIAAQPETPRPRGGGLIEEAAAALETASKDSVGRQGRRPIGRLSLASMIRELPLGRPGRPPPRPGTRRPEPDSDPELAYARASLRHLQGRLEEAVKLYDELAARDPANLLFLNNCAWILSEELGRPADGLDRIEKVIAKAGVQPHTLDTRGVIRLRLGRGDAAIADLEAAAGAIPSGPICYHLARAYLAAGRPKDAAGTLARARAAGLKAEQLQTSERGEMARIMASIP